MDGAFASSVGTGLSFYARFRAVASVIVLSIFTVIALIVAIHIQRGKHRVPAQAQVTDVVSTSTSKVQGRPVTYQTVKISYEYAGKSYSTTLHGLPENPPLAVGSTLTVYLRAHSPLDVSVSHLNPWIFWGIFGGLLLFTLLAALNLYLTLRSRSYAELEGGLTATSQLLRAV